MEAAAEDMRFEEAASLRNLIATVREVEEKQKMAAAEGENTDIFAYYAEPPLVAVNLFHLRNGHIVDRREFFWEDQQEFDPSEFFGALLKQVYLEPAVHSRAPSTCRWISTIAKNSKNCSRERAGRKVEILLPQRGAEESHAGAGGNEREAQLRSAVPRAEAVLESDSRQPCRMP